MVTVYIQKGTVQYLIGEVKFDIGPSKVLRYSNVEPCNAMLRAAFKMLRTLAGDTGRIAEWTRTWRVYWRADLRISGGPLLEGRWLDRQEAINAEVAYFNERGIA